MIAPWLQPPNVLGAMQAGAQVGLAQRAQRMNEIEAAQRLRLAYDQMAALQQREQMQMAMQSQIEGARLAQQLRESNAMEQWRTAQQGRWDADNKEQNRHNLAMEANAAARLAADNNASAFDYKPEVIELEGQKFAFNPKTGSFKSLATDKDISSKDALSLAGRIYDAAKNADPEGNSYKQLMARAEALYDYARKTSPELGLPKQTTGVRTVEPPAPAVPQSIAKSMAGQIFRSATIPGIALSRWQSQQPEAPQAATAPAQPVAQPQMQAPPPPPVPERVPGTAYQTPKGVFIWTGQGWTAP